jgi:protein-tyrosine phosphatase
MKLDRGVELALDDPRPTVTDARLRLAGTRFALVEFPYFTIPSNSTEPLMHMKASGVTPIVAHPERYDDIERHAATFREWKQAGAFLQMNAGSLAGAYGARVERNAWRCLEMGIVDYISSDYHARGKCSVTQARERLIARLGASQVKTLSEENGERLLEGLDPIPLLPLSPRSRWTRLMRVLRRD